MLTKFRSVLLLTFALLSLLLLAACQSTVTKKPEPTKPAPPVPSAQAKKASYQLLDYAALPGWGQDDLTKAWPAFAASCKALRKNTDWQEICIIADNVDMNDEAEIRHFFETFFNPYQVINPDGKETGLITGYYEPLLNGSRQRRGDYQTPLYQAPDDLLTIDIADVYPELKGLRLRGRLVGNKVIPYPNRAELLTSENLAGQEICWVDDPVGAFFLQVQGSGRVYFADTNETVRLAYADQNGRPYKSIGRYLVDQGELKLEQASAQGIKNWITKNPSRADEVLNANPSYVFFREEKITDPRIGPKGALGVPLSEQRSIAIDPKFIPLGAPIFINTTEPNSTVPLRRLMMAQDTGGAIRGAVRADFFWGFGDAAGEQAGRMKQQGMLWILWPKLAGKRLNQL
jgi:membrane-bound lytic murein transglycosylase A